MEAKRLKTKDMTSGNAMAIIIKFAIPLFIGNIFQQIYTVVDTMIAGYNLGDSAIAAIGATSSLYSLVMNVAWGLNGGFSIIVAQKFGAHDDRKFKQATATMITLNVITAVILTLLTLLCLKPMLSFLNTPTKVYYQAYIYIVIICGGMAATMMYNMFASFLRAIGNSSTPLYFLIMSCAINLGMDILLVVILKIGIAGAAIATVFAELCSAIFCGVYITAKYKPLLPKKEDFRMNKEICFEMITGGVAMAMMQCVFAIGSVILQRAINGLGDTVITAHTAARRIIEILMQPLSTIASATSTFVSQNWGAKKYNRIRKTMVQSLLLEAGWGIFAALLVFGFGKIFIVAMTGTNNPDVINNAFMNLKINFFFYPELGVLLCLRMAMQGMGQKVFPVISSSIELIFKIVASLFVIPLYGYVSASFTEPITWLVCMLFLSVAYFTMKSKISKRDSRL